MKYKTFYKTIKIEIAYKGRDSRGRLYFKIISGDDEYIYYDRCEKIINGDVNCFADLIKVGNNIEILVRAEKNRLLAYPSHRRYAIRKG